jgi:hypothetical protein
MYFPMLPSPLLRTLFRRKHATSWDVTVAPLCPKKLRRIRPEDQFIACFPRSGITWVRLVLRDIVVAGREENGAEAPTAAAMFPDLQVNPGDQGFSLEGQESLIWRGDEVRAGQIGLKRPT